MCGASTKKPEPEQAVTTTQDGDPTRTITEAYSRFISLELLSLMGKEGITSIKLGDHVEKTMSILFSDIRDFTSLSEDMTPRENFEFINEYLKQMEPVIIRHSGIIDKFIGDAIMALFPNGADDSLQCAISMLRQLDTYNKNRNRSGYPSIRIGVGLNTGIMMLGIIGGKHHMESTVISDAVNLASRMESMTKSYSTQILISEHTYYSLQDASLFDIRFIDRVKVKGKEQCQSVFEVFDADPPLLRDAKRATKGIFEEALAHYHFKEIPQAIILLSECLHQAPDDSVARVYHKRCEDFLATGIHENSGEINLTVKWDATFAIGHPGIDAEHNDLFEHVSGFVAAIRNGRNYSELHSIIEFLDDYVARHFATEEKCMLETGYPFLQLQIDQHRRFSRYFEAFKEEIKKDLDIHRTFLLFRAQVLVIDWLVNHTSKLDRHFGKFFAMAQQIQKRIQPLNEEQNHY